MKQKWAKFEMENHWPYLIYVITGESKLGSLKPSEAMTLDVVKSPTGDLSPACIAGDL